MESPTIPLARWAERLQFYAVAVEVHRWCIGTSQIKPYKAKRMSLLVTPQVEADWVTKPEFPSCSAGHKCMVHTLLSVMSIITARFSWTSVLFCSLGFKVEVLAKQDILQGL